MAGDDTLKRLDDVAFYRLIRARMEHEDVLIVNRLAWLMASESFLFTAYAIVLNGLSGSQGHHFRLLQMIPLVGIATSTLIFAGIFAAIRALSWLWGMLRARIPDERALGLPPIRTPLSIVVPGQAAPVLLPLVFIAVWLYLLATHPR